MKIILNLAAIFITTICSAQQLSQVTFSFDGKLQYFTVSTEQNVLLRISPLGELMEYGTEEASIYQNNYYSPRLRPYIGRVDFYGNESDEALRGKPRTIGITGINWLPKYEIALKAGKIKSIGRLTLDYYDNFAPAGMQGKIKSIGNLNLNYYASPSDDEFLKDKLRSIGNANISYFSSFDDRAIKGKLKAIGTINYDWYTSFDINRSGLKNGNYRNTLDGVTYIIQ